MDQVSQIREQVDIVAVMGDYLPLKKAGRNFKTNCPFHNEKSPSLVISPERQIWHCFGCAKGGDVFSFLMEYERLEFPEALRMLAARVGITLERDTYQGSKTSEKERLYSLNKLVGEYYHFLLTKHAIGKKALAYVTKERGVSPKTIETFMIGFSPTTGTALVDYLVKKKNYSVDELFEAGLVTRRNGQVVDFFQGRLMFALFDHRDNVVGFSGRIMEKSDTAPKYINTRETLVYHKGSTFFGIQVTKDAIKKADCAILMEGEFDLISSFQEGISNVVAVKGTALTIEQVNLLSRYAKKIQLCFDMDNAGQEAIKRSLAIIEKKNLRASVISLPDGKDADELIKTNPVAYKQAVKADTDVYEYLLQRTLTLNDRHGISGKQRIGEELLPLFSQIQNQIVKEHYITKLGKELGTSYESLLKEIERLEKKEVVRQDVTLISPSSRSREEVLEEYFLSLLVQSAHVKPLIDSIMTLISVYRFTLPAYQQVWQHLIAYVASHETFVPKDFAVSLPAEIVPAFDSCFLLPLPKFTLEQEYLQEVNKVAQEMYGLFVHDQITIIATRIEEKEKAGNVEELEALQHQLTHLVSLLKKK